MADTTQTNEAKKNLPDAANRPAVGIIATADNANEVAGALLRARRHGYEPLVYAAVVDSEAVQVADQLGVQVIDAAGSLRDESDRWDRLASEARENGYPGLIRHADLSLAVDFETTKAAVQKTPAYIVTPSYRSRLDATPEILAAIPAYNESHTIDRVVEKTLPHADTVVVIDDGSTDTTVELARQAGATVIEHETNKGYGGALKTAFGEAARVGADHLVILDGDGQHDPADIPKLVARQRENDTEIVIGSRFETGSETDLPLYRRAGVRVVNLLTNLSLGVVRSRSRIGDTQSGFRAYNREAIESLAADNEIGNHMGASTDILYHAHRHGHDVAEVGTTIDYDVEDASSKHPVSHGLQLVQNILRTIERERPVTVLGVPGVISSVIGIGFGYLTFSNYLASGVFPLGLALVSVFFTLTGIFATFTAIILHSLEMHRN